MLRSHESAERAMGTGLPLRSGTKDSHLTILATPSKSSLAVIWETPFLYMICVPPSCKFEVYTSRPSSLLMAGAPVRMMG